MADQEGHEGDPEMNRAGLKDMLAKKGKNKSKDIPVEPKKTIEEIGLPKELRFSGRSNGIIINNPFEGKEGEELPGYAYDEVNIVRTFGELNVDFEIKRGLTAKKMTNNLAIWLDGTSFDDSDCSICFILTHGDDDGLLYGEDKNTVKIEKIKSMFIDCKKLDGKPKLFFIQACRGMMDSKAVTISTGIKTAGATQKAKDADVFQFFPTAPGRVSWVGKTGSLFIKTLCNVVQAYGSKFHLQDIVTKVNEILAYDIRNIRENLGWTVVCEAPETTHSLTYNLYFNDRNEKENEDPVSK